MKLLLAKIRREQYPGEQVAFGQRDRAGINVGDGRIVEVEVVECVAAFEIEPLP